jgi:hypothetical protein
VLLALMLLQLQPGTMEISKPIEITGPHAEVRGAGTILRAAANFKGAALLVCRGCTDAVFTGFTIDGNRSTLEHRAGLPPSDVTFARFTPNSGILLENAHGVRISDVKFRNIAGFAVLASNSRDVAVANVDVRDSGSRDPRGRNNTTGGILFENGTAGFRVENSTFENIRGNGVWTHSRYTAARNRDGLIAGNRFREIGRDAIQVGHAVNVRVERNQGTRIAVACPT